MKKLPISGLIFFILSCNNSNSVPPGIIEPTKMQQVFWDMIRGNLLAEEIVKKDSTQTIKSAGFTITQKIFAIHNINREKFERSVSFYEKHPVLLKTIFDSLNSIQTRRSSLEFEKKEKMMKDRFSHPKKIP